jgi:integrase
MVLPDALYQRDGLFISASGAKSGFPLTFVADHLRTAAIAIGIPIEKGQSFGLHNLRHSLSNWLINKAKTEPKTVKGLLRHSRIQTTLDFYAQEDARKHGPPKESPLRRSECAQPWCSSCGLSCGLALLL